jgi:hypothetical protein
MKQIVSFLVLLMLSQVSFSQAPIETIKSRFALYTEREKLNRSLFERTIRQSFSLPLNSETEYRFQSSFYSVSQFLINDSMVHVGFKKTIAAYDSLEWETRRSFLEAIYALNPEGYTNDIEKIFQKELHPKGLAMAAVFLCRRDSSQVKKIRQQLQKRFVQYSSEPMFFELDKYLTTYSTVKKISIPDITNLFSAQQQHGRKMIYSLQRWNRDFPGLAIIQDANGKFARDSDGRLIIIRQLARSASNLPYFITNGNTPQGVFSIQGTGVSTNQMIGPTPNIQMIMPNEKNWNSFFHGPADTSFPLLTYSELLPESWRDYLPMQESFYAGKLGRTEIIAHGTTIDPQYFADRPFYPISPTLGCLCARETWNTTTGGLSESEQYRLASTYMAAEGEDGYFIVINLDHKNAEVSRNEIEKIVEDYEKAFSTSASKRHLSNKISPPGNR